jgi:ABC-2 type transport system permease protein
MTTTSTARPAAAGGTLSSAARDGLIIMWRNLKRIPRIPELAIFAILQSIMFVLLFAFVFGGAIPLPGGGSYREFLMPGIFAQTIVFAAGTTSIGMADDIGLRRPTLDDVFLALTGHAAESAWGDEDTTPEEKSA